MGSQWVGGAALVGVLLLTGCSGGHDAALADVEPPSPDPVVVAPTPPAPAPPVTVVGERVPAAHWVNSTGLLTHRASEMGTGDTVLPFVHTVADWLDRHLDDLQRGGPGLLGDVVNPELLAGATDADVAAVTTGLAAPDRLVAHATYRLDASYDAETEWLTAGVVVTDRGGADHAATLVFVPTPDGPQLVLFGSAGDGA